MVSKRNSRLLRKMLTAIAGSLILGNCSTVWMMEPPKKSFNDIKNEFQTTRNTVIKGKWGGPTLNVFALLNNSDYYKVFLLKKVSKSCGYHATKEINPPYDINKYVDDKFKDFASAFKGYLGLKGNEENYNMEESDFEKRLSSFYKKEGNRSKVNDLIDACYTQESMLRKNSVNFPNPQKP